MRNTLLSNPKVVVVDNKKDELDQITTALHAASIPCLPVLYDAAEWPPEPLISASASVRLVFLDLNLLDSTTPDAKTIVQHTAAVLRAVIASGPYILVFWTKHQELAGEVIELLRERYKDDVVAPLKWLAFDKLEFQMAGDDEARDQQVEALAGRVRSIIDTSPPLRALTNWEARVSNSVASTVSRLNEIATGTDPWDFAATEARLSSLLTWIAHEAVGRQVATTAPGEAVEQGLVSALGDDLSRSAPDDDYVAVWRAAMPDLGKRDFAHDPQFAAAHLNQVFHIDTSSLKKDARGTFVFLAPAVLGELEQIFGLTIRAIKAEFINLENVERGSRDALLDECRLGLIELSAACDHAQRKERSLRYVLAILIPYAHVRHTQFGDVDVTGKRPRSIKHDAIYRLPPIRIGSNDFICKLNFRHILGLPPTSELLGDPYFRVRVPLLDEIAYRCANHLARPGIVAFHRDPYL